MRKMQRSQMRLWAVRHLKEVQQGVCPLCGLPIDLSIKGEGVIDHNHITGEIRAVLHRSCNAAEGKVAHAASRWGSKSTDPDAVAAWVARLVQYWHAPGTGWIYPMHLTEDERADKRKAADKMRRAKAKAAREIAKQRKAGHEA
jgi:hypothetical protein